MPAVSGVWGWVRSRDRGRWAIERWLVLAAGLASATPIVVATARAVVDRWYPLGDDASSAVRAYDVLTAHSPLLGPASQVSGLVGQPLYSPGPLVYWPAAVPARWGGPTAMIVVVGLINIACVMGVVALARRRGGPTLMFATAILMPLMLASLPAVAYRDVWAQAAALMPFTLLIFVAWSLAVGEYRLLPLAILLASFVAQAHLAYVLPAGGLLLIGLGGLLISRRGGGTSPRPAPVGRGAEVARTSASPRRWILAAALVGLLCWAPPLLEQAQHRPGNLVLIGRAATKRKVTLGTDVGWHAVVRAFGVPPWWLRGFQTPEERIRDVGFTPTRSAPTPPGLPVLSIVSALLVLGAVVATLVAAARRRRHDMVAAMAVSLVLAAALFVLVLSTPSHERRFVSLGYTTWWASAAGLWVWLSLGWCLAVLLRIEPRLRALAWPERVSAATARPLAATLGIVAIVALGVFAAEGAGSDPLRSAYRPLRAMAAAVEARVPRGRAVLVESGPSFTALDVEPAVIYALRHRGVAVVTAEQAIQLGHAYDPHPGSYGYVVRVDGGRKSPPPGGQVIARVKLGSPENKSLLIGRLSAANGIVSVLGSPARSSLSGR
jgi:hypothetical protein